MKEATIYSAKRIVTLDAVTPEATAVATRDGRIVAVGALEDVVRQAGPARVDDQFSDRVILPGFVEAHSHILAGSIWEHLYLGFYDRIDPNGELWHGLPDIISVVERLKRRDAQSADRDAPLIGWGFDPIFFTGRRMTVADLDQVSTTRPVIVYHQSFHALNVNSVVLRIAGMEQGGGVNGVVCDEAGKPTGELHGIGVMQIALQACRADLFSNTSSDAALWNYGKIAQRTGTTTITDMFSALGEAEVGMMTRITSEDHFPARIIPALRVTGDLDQAIERLSTLKRMQSDKLRFGLVKLVTDGAIQTYTARLNEPYYDGKPNGIWNTSKPELKRQVSAFHHAGHSVHIHTNGDQAVEVALSVMDEVLAEAPRPDHRHTLHHCQLARTEHFAKAKQLGLCVNIFSNHIYYYGDIHYARTLGPERAQRINAAESARKAGVPFSIHSDAPVTPLAPLFTAWVAANRRTATGRTLGEHERLSVEDAIYAITLGAAYTLHMEKEVGSITPGKLADFAVLDADPFAVGAAGLKDIQIVGTVLGGRPFPIMN